MAERDNGDKKGGQGAQARHARLAAALRQNLQRRKNQGRARRAGAADARAEGLPAAHAAAPIGGGPGEGDA